MKRLPFAVGLIAASLLIVPVEAQNLEAELQRAAQQEMVSGNLKTAIADYQAIVAKSGRNHGVAAQALLRMADAYRKLGDAESRRVYERLIREYPDQKSAVEIARSRLGGAATLAYSLAWSGPKVDAEGTISPEGRYLSYTDWDTGNLGLHDFEEKTDRPLTNGGTWAGQAQYAEESTISRDGKQVAYSWFNSEGRYELRVLPLTANGFPPPRRLFTSAEVMWIGPYDWSPDGRWIAVEIDRVDGVQQMGIVSVQDGRLRVLKGTGWGGSTILRFSRDGRFVAFDYPTSTDKRGRSVSLVAVDGSGETDVVAHDSLNRLIDWSPDGAWLLFASDRRGSMDLWGLPVANGKPQGAARLLKVEVGGWSVGVTRSGVLLMGARVSDRDISIVPVDLAGAKATGAPVRPVTSYFGSGVFPDWSPDGNRLAYVSQTFSGRSAVLVVRDLESGRVTEYPTQFRYLQVPRWAPDGRSLVAQGQPQQGTRGIFRIDAATGAATPLVSTGALLMDPDWSRDGAKIYYRQEMDGAYASQGLSALIEHDLASGHSRELFRGVGLSGASVAPDGRTLAVRRLEGRSTIMMSIPVDGGPPRETARLNEPDAFLGRGPTWTPDGRELLTFSRVAGAVRPTIVPIDGSPIRRIDIDSKSFNVNAPIRVHPDGRQMAYVEGVVQMEVWKLEHFLPTR
jgi:Tol biopolymer transport system component